MQKVVKIFFVTLLIILFAGAIFYVLQDRKISPTVLDQSVLSPTPLTAKDETRPMTTDMPPVPPVPNKNENDATLAGIDVNGNGVRDDVEIYLLEKYGMNEAAKSFTLKTARRLQAALIEPRPSEEQTRKLEEQGVKNPYIGKLAQEYLTSLECMDPRELEQSTDITKITLTTPSRKSAYATLFAGAIIGGCDSEKEH